MNIIKLLEYAMPATATTAARHKNDGWRYLGNKKSYQRSASVRNSDAISDEVKQTQRAAK